MYQTKKSFHSPANIIQNKCVYKIAKCSYFSVLAAFDEYKNNSIKYSIPTAAKRLTKWIDKGIWIPNT